MDLWGFNGYQERGYCQHEGGFQDGGGGGIEEVSVAVK